MIGGPRVDRIDTATNEVFYGCTGPWEVEDRFHAFWNRLNDSWEYDVPTGKEKVLVLRVEEVRAADLKAIVDLTERRGS